jgi:glycine/D-amino acid oxidase-like deaminating enzyme/nitrite reductase/ring-hydroxylating ferredoxin subunit
MTARTTAHLSNALDDRFFELERLFGEEGARLAADSHTAAIDRIEAIVAEEGIACDFERLDGYLFLAEDATPQLLHDELAAAHRAGLVAVRSLSRAPLEAFDTGPCLHFPDQAQFHPIKYLAGLARAIERLGGQLYTPMHATAITGGDPARVETATGAVVTCAAVVVATNTPVNDRVAIHTKQAPYVTYAIAARVARGAVPRLLLWDAPRDLDQPYHYIRVLPGADHDLLIVGGEDHKTGQASDGLERWANLERWTRARFPIQGIARHWSGQVMEPVDGLAFIGRNPLDHGNVYIATGDSGMGLTHGTIAGILLTDLIQERPNRWADLYDPSRKTLGALREFARENLNVAAQYSDLVTPGEVELEAIRPGTGAVVRRGLTKIAAYRDAGGVLHQRSAICPHLGCVVAWNGVEQTWDCPCHGSRFACDGRVVQGPANSDLAALDE